jgi:hypothetical protein
MAQQYEIVATFFENADAHAEFLKRVAARLVEWAVDERGNIPASPSAAEVARQNFAVAVLLGSRAVMAQASKILPALAVRANDADLIDANGYITATDIQIAGVVNSDFIDLHAGHVPPAS